jgi:hypothetical protein
LIGQARRFDDRLPPLDDQLFGPSPRTGTWPCNTLQLTHIAHPLVEASEISVWPFKTRFHQRDLAATPSDSVLNSL